MTASTRFFSAALIVLALLGISAGQAQNPTVVTTIEARPGRLQTVRETSVIIRPQEVTEVSAQTSGRVLEVARRQDMPVVAGELVVRLDTQQLELELQNTTLALSTAQVSLNNARAANEGQQLQANVTVRSAEASYRAAQQQFLEGQELFEIGAISRVALDELEAAALEAEAALAQAQGTLETAESGDGGNLELLALQVQQAEAQVAEAQQALKQANITSPISGEITQLLVQQGSFVNRGSPVFRVATTQQQVAVLNLPLEVANRLRTKGALAIPYGGSTYPAEFLSVSTIDPTTQLVEVTARLRPSENPIPNGAVTQFSFTYGGSGGLILPSGALQLEPGRRFVFLYQNGRAVRESIELIGESDDQVAIVGIPIGARVIYPLPTNLRDGAAVELARNN